MYKLKKFNEVVITGGLASNPYGKFIRTERRLGLGDRRRLIIYIADDFRDRLADKRDHKGF